MLTLPLPMQWQCRRRQDVQGKVCREQVVLMWGQDHQRASRGLGHGFQAVIRWRGFQLGWGVLLGR